MRIGSYLIKADQLCDRIPVISILSCAVDLVAKAIFQILRSLNLHWFEGDYTVHLANKSKLRCVLLMVPVFGNLWIFWSDRSRVPTSPKDCRTVIVEGGIEDLTAMLKRVGGTDDLGKFMRSHLSMPTEKEKYAVQLAFLALRAAYNPILSVCVFSSQGIVERMGSVVSKEDKDFIQALLSSNRFSSSLGSEGKERIMNEEVHAYLTRINIQGF